MCSRQIKIELYRIQRTFSIYVSTVVKPQISHIGTISWQVPVISIHTYSVGEVKIYWYNTEIFRGFRYSVTYFKCISSSKY